MTEELQSLAQHFEFTLCFEPEYRDWAERFFERAEKNADYGTYLVDLIKDQDTNDMVRLASATALKNFVQSNWNKKNENQTSIKCCILTIMPQVSSAVQNQLRETIKIIVEYDSLLKWPQLVDDIMDQLNSDDLFRVQSALNTCHSLFKRYRYKCGSHKIWKEIKFVVNQFAQPLSNLIQKLITMTKTFNELHTVYNLVLVSCKIFYSLNAQHLHQVYEDRMNIWMHSFHDVLIIDITGLSARDVGVLEHLCAQTCLNLVLYVQKYFEQIEKYLNVLINDTWTLLNRIKSQRKYDLVFQSAMKFVSKVASQMQCRHLFKDRNVLKIIIEKLIITNIDFTALIEHLFQEVPETCPLCDLNSNNIDARSQVTCDLFGILLQNYQTDTMEIFNEYFQTLLLDQRLTLAQISNVKQHLQTQNVAVFITAACVLKKSLKFLAPNHVMLQLSEIRNIVSNHSLKWNFISALFRTENVLVHRNRYSNATNATNLMEYVQIFSNDNVIDEINADIFSNKKFEDFRFKPEIMEAIRSFGINWMSKVQEQTISLLFSTGFSSCYVESNPGTGKTVAYVIAMLNEVDLTLDRPQVLCICWSYEAAKQTLDVTSKLNTHSRVNVSQILRSENVVLGSSISSQIIIGTPPELASAKLANMFDFRHVTLVIIDDADAVLTSQVVTKLLTTVPSSSKRIGFSSSSNRNLFEKLRPTISLNMSDHKQFFEGYPQYYLKCTNFDTKCFVIHTIYEALSVGVSAMVFCNKRSSAEMLWNKLQQAGAAVGISTSQRTIQQRDEVLMLLRSGILKMVITTNLLSRAIDIQSVNLIVNFELALNANGTADFKSYMYRVGRAGRFGRSKIALNLVDDTDLVQLNNISSYFDFPLHVLN